MAGVAIVALSTAVAVTVLWWAGTSGLNGKDLVSARLDALKVGLSFAVAAGGGFALYLAWRRQRSTEADLDNRERALAHQQHVSTATEKDAEGRRITELYGKALEQLGSDKAPVRLGGLYALERLAQDHEEQRQTIVNVWCAYLRMPYKPLDDAPNSEADEKALRDYVEQQQEREVRLTAQRLLYINLSNARTKHWTNISIDLSGATLVNFDLSGCTVNHAFFRRATFVGPSFFMATTFMGRAEFRYARFNYADFDSATFGGPTAFDSATFDDYASFMTATFAHDAGFPNVTFNEGVDFYETKFAGHADFRGSKHVQDLHLEQAIFAQKPTFRASIFPDGISRKA